MLKTGQFAFDELLVSADAEQPAKLRLRLSNGATIELSLPAAALGSLASGLAARIRPR